MTRSGALAALTTATLAACSEVTGSVGNNDFLAEAPLQYDLDATARTSFRVEGINGEIDVVATVGTESFTIRGERQVRSDSRADAESYLTQLQVVITELGDEIYIRTVQPANTGNRQVVVNYRLTVPARLIAHLENVNGSVTVTDLAASVDVALVNGSIACRAIMAAGDAIDLQLVNGTLVLDVPVNTSAQFSAQVVNGSISTGNLPLQGVQTGSTWLTGTLGGGQGTIDLRTVNGTILARGF